jgi:hypothetical protein
MVDLQSVFYILAICSLIGIPIFLTEVFLVKFRPQT